MSIVSLVNKLCPCFTGRMPLEQVSYSSLKQWSTCPRLGYFGQYLGLEKKEQVRTGAMPFGSRIHTALELWGRSGWTIPAATIWQKLMDREWEIAEEMAFPPEDLDKESKMGQIMLEGFERWLEEQGVYGHWKVVGIEVKLSTVLTIELESGEQIDVLLRGKLDVLSQDQLSGDLYVEDYKTTSSLTEESKLALLNESQGPMYVILERRQAGQTHRVSGFILTMLRKVMRGPSSKPPYYERLVEPYTEDRLLAAEQNVRAQVDRVASIVGKLDAGADHRNVAPFQTSWQCKTCPFKLPCYEMQQGNFSGGDRMLLDLYVKGNPLQRYEEDPANTLTGLGFLDKGV